MIRGLIVFYLLKCTLSKWCNDTIHFSNGQGSLSSPRPQSSQLYPDNTNCTWNISIPGNQLHIKLSFDSFHFEDCPDCSCDYIEILDIVSSRQISLGKFCGSQLPGPFFSSEQSLVVIFQSDHGDSSIGFTASYSSVLPGAVCGNVTRLITQVGHLHSPEFPSKYPNNQECVWQITTPPNSRMTFKVLSLAVQNCSTTGDPLACSCDFVEIRDGSSSTDRLLARLCGSNIPPWLYSSGRHLWVKFKSDSAVTDSGFAASFSSSSIDKNSCPAVWKYPIRCPERGNVNTNKTQACCYDNGPKCCDPGGNRCTDKGSNERDYCPRPGDEKKLIHCCMKEGRPSCCCSGELSLTVSIFLMFGAMVTHVTCFLNT